MHILLNWVWQGCTLVLVTTVSLRAMRHLSATSRYLVWWTTMILVLLLPVLPPLIALSGAPPRPPDAIPAIAPMPLPDLPAWPLLIVAGCWALWVSTALIRVAVSLATFVRARRTATTFPQTREARLTHWSALHSTGRRARLVMSDRVASAAVLGLGEPVIAVSPAAAARLTDSELDQVLLHEWAHVQRRDDFARLAQLAIRSVAGLHPAVWWIGRQLEIERETACDDFAVNVTGAARSLARCLAKLAEIPEHGAAPVLAPGAVIATQLTTRVVRLLDPRRNTSTQRPRALLGALGTVLAILALALSNVELVVATTPMLLPRAQTPAAMPLTAPAIPPRDAARPAATPGPAGPVPRASMPGAATRVEQVLPPPVAHQSSQALPVLAPVGDRVWSLPELPTVSEAMPSTPSVEPLVVPSPANGADASPVTPWGAAADAGVAVGHGSQKAATATADAGTSIARGSEKAAVATAGYFSKLGRKLAGSF